MNYKDFYDRSLAAPELFWKEEAHAIKWFEFPACYIYHVVNAWEEGDEVITGPYATVSRKLEGGKQITVVDEDEIIFSTRCNRKGADLLIVPHWN